MHNSHHFQSCRQALSLPNSHYFDNKDQAENSHKDLCLKYYDQETKPFLKKIASKHFLTYKDKEKINSLFDNIDKIKNGRKAIVWMPTHRSCGKNKINISQLVDLDKLQQICELNDIVFIVKKHFYHKNESEDFSLYPNIFDVTNLDVDATVILAQADALISDYSASYIEYLALENSKKNK